GRAPLRHVRMLEVLRRVARHADPFHHAARADVLDRRERDDLVEPDLLEAEREHCAGRLARIALIPVVASEAPGDLDSGNKPGLVQPYDAGELARALDFDRPQPPAPPGQDSALPLDERRAPLAAERPR